MTWATRFDHPGMVPWGVSWIISAPWAHPVWPQFGLYLYDLTSAHKDGPPTIHLPGATHEFLLYALDPAKPIPRNAESAAGAGRLTPANYGYQFKAESNEAAQDRLQRVVDQIMVKNLSPDTDWRAHWDEFVFPDAYPLVR